MRIAINQPQSHGWHRRWQQWLEAKGIEHGWVDVYAGDFLQRIRGYDGYLWRFADYFNDYNHAKRMMPVLEQYMGLRVFPGWWDAWHYDDKVAQAYLLEGLGVSIPKTWILHTEQQAQEWLETASFPVVFKLAVGAGSMNVELIRSREEAAGRVSQMFWHGLRSLDDEQYAHGVVKARKGAHRVRDAARLLVRGRAPLLPYERIHVPAQRDYMLFQEYVPGNEFDTRCTVIGNRIFAFRRFNRTGDFRASGSGRIDWDQGAIEPKALELSAAVARKLKTASIALDILKHPDGRLVINDISYTYNDKAVFQCPGHWAMCEGAGLKWVEGAMWPEDAIISDLVAAIEQRQTGGGRVEIS